MAQVFNDRLGQQARIGYPAVSQAYLPFTRQLGNRDERQPVTGCRYLTPSPPCLKVDLLVRIRASSPSLPFSLE